MGASISQDAGFEQNNEESSNIASQISNTDPKPNQSSREVPLPHSCEDILKHADSPVDRSSTKKLLEQLYAGVFLNQKRKASDLFFF